MRLTKAQLKQRDALEEAEAAADEAESHLWALHDRHKKHVLVKDGNQAMCAICNRSFGWWCPKSKDHKCRYTKRSESCKYCGDPEERK